MALAVDASSPAVVQGSTSTTSTASFTPPANCSIVAYVMADAGNGTTDEAVTVSGGGLSWARAAQNNGSPGAVVEAWVATSVSSPGSMTVDCTDNKGAVAKRVFARVYTDTGNGTPAGVGATNTGTGNSLAYTSTVANSWGWSVWLGSTTPTAGTGQTLDDSTGGTGPDGDSTGVEKQNATTSTAGTSVTNSVTMSTLHGVAVEVLPGTGAASIPPPLQRTVQGRDPGEAWWLQRDRRDANTVATAANPLPSPLDSAWQADARYWHLYGDSAAAAPRTWQSLQRNYVSDPNLLGPVVTDPLTLAAGVGGDLWRRYNAPDFADRREVPQQPIRESNPSLLGSALLENELLGGADSARHAQAAAFVDRREVPQQRLYVSDPLLLATAELENELLGGADTAKRANVPATHAPRWWMPQQPQREGYSPGLLDSALLENELLGSADDVRRRTNLAATHADRREVPFQPPRWTVYFDAGPDVPPLTLSWGAGGRYWALYNQAGWQPDRREVPQQRAYISDPSFYPTTAPTDPLTVAWGAGGTYWLLYNQAALQVDRREVPQQRRYVSDPGLLSTALLENELLGSADDLRRRYLTAALFTDRREVPQQRPYLAYPGMLGALLENELLGGADDRQRHAAWFTDRRQAPQQLHWVDPSLLGPAPTDPLTLAAGVGGDLWRRTNTSAYADRREVPQQPNRWTVYFDAGPGLPPLTLSWGAGGNLWHLYNRAADIVDRTYWHQLILPWPLPQSGAAGRLAPSTGSASLATVTSSARLGPSTSGGDA